MQVSSPTAAPAWITKVLYAAAVYNLTWGAFVVFAPMTFFHWAGMVEPRYPEIWQCVGMIVGVYGVGYWIAARAPFRHWPIVIVGFLGKVFGPIGFLSAAMTGKLPWSWGVIVLMNDLIWWFPFAAILYHTFRYHSDTSLQSSSLNFSDAVRDIKSHRNASLLELSSDATTLVVFLRHSGCTFCRETLSRLAKYRTAMERMGTHLAIVHMSSPMDGALMIEKYGIHDVHKFSDPHCVLYRAFGLKRGSLSQLISPRIIAHAFRALWNGNGLGKIVGDGFRMHGAFVLVDGKMVAEHRGSAADDHAHFLTLISRVASRATACRH